MKKEMLLVIIGGIMIFSIYSVSAISLIPRLSLCENSGKCYDSLSNILLNPSNNITLKVGIINNQGKWICWDSFNYQFDIVSESQQNNKINVQRGFGSTNSYNQNPAFCFAPDNTQEHLFYIPLNDFNKRSLDQKIGTWTIASFNLGISNLKCYSTISMLNSDCGDFNQASSFKGNNIKFIVALDEPKTGLNFGNNFSTILKVLAIVSLIVLGVSITEAFKSKKKSKWIWTTLIFLVLTFILGKYGFWPN